MQKCGMATQKGLHYRHNSFVGVLDDVVAAVGEAVDFGVRPVLEQSLQARRTEAPVTHAPDQLSRQVSERRQSGFDLLQQLPGGLARRKWNVAYESVDCDATA